MKKSILQFLSNIVAPVPYPAAAGWHAIAGSFLFWVVRGCPRTYSGVQLLTGLACSVAIGLAAVLILHVLDERNKTQ